MEPTIVPLSTLSGGESLCEQELCLLPPAAFTWTSYTLTNRDAHSSPDQVPALVLASPMFACLLIPQRISAYSGLPDSHADIHTKYSRKVNWLLDGAP